MRHCDRRGRQCEDPIVNRLQERVAALLGEEEAGAAISSGALIEPIATERGAYTAGRAREVV